MGRRKASERREPVFDVSPGLAPEPATSVQVDSAGDPPHRPSPRKPRKRGGQRKAKASRSGFGRKIYWGAVASLWLVIGAIGAVIAMGIYLPPIQSLEIPKRPPSIQIADFNGRVLATRGEFYGDPVSLKALPKHVPQAFIAIEDRRFYSHWGVDPIGVSRALYTNLMHRGVAQGGSTITQQLAKNLFLTQERTLKRKMQELALAFWLEGKFSKTEIIELYLNRVYFGAGAYGIEAAAQRYFGKGAQKLSVAEAAMLAGLVRSPSRLAPSHNPDGAARRAQIVLAAMAEMDFVTDETAKAAMLKPAQAVKSTGGGSAQYAADWVMDVLNELIGRVDQDIIVETTIDPMLQADAEKSLLDELAKNGSKAGVSQGAIVSMTPEGAVRALVGGRNYTESQFNRAVTAKRQPGSAFKPFVYLTAIERGLTPDTMREDKPVSIRGWKPENYTREYYGPITLRQALAMSLNTVAVRLTQEFGPTAVIRTAHRLGISSKLEPNASIALGTSEVSLLELVSSLAPFANGGFEATPHVIERVRTASGKLLYNRDQQSLGRIVEPRYVAMMNAMMHETLITGTARKADVPGWTAAGKTGTSQDFRDAWFIGYTAHLVTGVWLGNDDNSPTRKTTGGGMPVEVWTRIMKPAHQSVAVAGLPGLQQGPRTAGLLPSFGWTARTPAAPVAPPAAVPARGGSSNSNVRPEPGSVRPEAGSMDTWLLDRLFGRR
jgi:penicillin-binding protein 1A